MKHQLQTIRAGLETATCYSMLGVDAHSVQIALTALAQLEAMAGEQEPMFWVRLCSDGMYEGPIHNAQIERVRAQSGAWSPLFLGAAPVAQQDEHLTITWDEQKTRILAVTMQDADGRSILKVLAEAPATDTPVWREGVGGLPYQVSNFACQTCGYVGKHDAHPGCKQQPQADLLAAAKEFCRKVEAGEARSTTSYAAFKLAIERIEKQPQAEAVPSVNTLLSQVRGVVEHTRDNPGVAFDVPDLVRVEGQKFMRGEPSLFDQIPLGDAMAITAAPQQAEVVPDEAQSVLNRLNSSDPDFDDCAAAAALIIRMAHELKGPDGFATWKDAAMAERMRRLETPPQQAEAVPPGYVLVPVEPTDEMIDAACKAVDDLYRVDFVRAYSDAIAAAAQGEKP